MRAGRKESGGHIATAVHQECFSLVGDDGLFLPKKTLVKSFRNSFDINKPLVAYWGGGICATINLFLMEYVQIPTAKNGTARLYDDSLKGWVQDKNNPLTFTAESRL